MVLTNAVRAMSVAFLPHPLPADWTVDSKTSLPRTDWVPNSTEPPHQPWTIYTGTMARKRSLSILIMLSHVSVSTAHLYSP